MSEFLDVLNKMGVEIEDVLERFMNDEEMYLKYVRQFPDEPSMKKLVKAVDVQDYKQAEDDVHALKGIVHNLGFTSLADATTDMLEELRDGNIEDAMEAYESVKREYQKFCDAINAWRN